jgi:hypothetical protein
LVDDLIFHMNHGMARLTGQEHDRSLNFLVGLLLNRAFNSLWRAREDALRGYPGECLALCRLALELWASAKWVNEHPSEVGLWLWDILEELDEPTRGPPSVDAMLRDLGEAGSAVKVMYNILSKFAHPRSTGLSWIIHFDEGNTYFHAGGHFDERGLRMCLYFLIGTAQACLDPVANLQARMLGEPDANWMARARELSDASARAMQRLRHEVESEADALPSG